MVAPILPTVRNGPFIALSMKQLVYLGPALRLHHLTSIEGVIGRAPTRDARRAVARVGGSGGS